MITVSRSSQPVTPASAFSSAEPGSSYRATPNSAGCASPLPADHTSLTGAGNCIVAQPNQSANWETNKQLLIGFSLFSCVIATAFSLIGAWMILPFAGLEITALGGALYIVCRKLNLRHVLRIDDHVLIIEKGCRQPQQRWRFNKAACSILVERRPHPWDPISLAICGFDEQNQLQHIPIGEFLNRADSQLLLDTLKQQGLTIRGDSRYGAVEI